MLQTVIIALWAVAAGLLAAYAASVASEITYVTLPDGRRMARSIPLAMRLLLPFAQNLNRFVRHARFAPQRAAADRMILSAGLEGLLAGEQFVALKFLMPLFWGLLWSFVIFSLAALWPESVFAGSALPLALFGILYAYMYPLLWLRKTLKARHMSIMRALPFVLDLLTLSVEAGMDFMSALMRNCKDRKIDPLNEELIRMGCEIQVGVSRATALRNLARRTDQPDLRAVAHALVQADELGASIGSVLRIQAEQLRSRRFDRAEKLAHEAPVKMLGPLMLCIFPAVFVILLAPVLLRAAGMME